MCGGHITIENTGTSRYPMHTTSDINNSPPCRVGSVGSVSASRTVGRGHTKNHHKNGTNCLPAWHAMR